MEILWIHAGCDSATPLPEMLAELADDGALFRSGGTDDALELCAVYAPELIILDVCALGGSELDCAARIKHDFPNIKLCTVIDIKNDALVKAAEVSGADIVAPEGISSEELNRLYQYSKMHYRVFPTSDF